MVCRASESFVRFGTFQLPASRGGDETALIRQLADYVIKHNYPHLAGKRACSIMFMCEHVCRVPRAASLMRRPFRCAGATCSCLRLGHAQCCNACLPTSSVGTAHFAAARAFALHPAQPTPPSTTPAASSG